MRFGEQTQSTTWQSRGYHTGQQYQSTTMQSRGYQTGLQAQSPSPSEYQTGLQIQSPSPSGCQTAEFETTYLSNTSVSNFTDDNQEEEYNFAVISNTDP